MLLGKDKIHPWQAERRGLSGDTLGTICDVRLAFKYCSSDGIFSLQGSRQPGYVRLISECGHPQSLIWA
ncbi:hypothetical protein HYPSUDRAFT_49299 [Hypholoma sublateritium FD-334 SS-4]|uniref:Uncharacterized protein n=1 Tax=Hypholoma sublateritium (strain FD-334 SS-4) TaxID=945553 RepID=A0A0D2P0Z4_HYPSF|nr:hypothetical protein HYPSUDRAFT_49299 [Hypholoma sublateritium FD-334 SS-4]